MIEVNIKLKFYEEEYDFEILTNGVPMTLIGQSLEDIAQDLYAGEIKDAKQVVGDAEMTKYMEAWIAVDRRKLEQLLKEQKNEGEGEE